LSRSIEDTKDDIRDLSMRLGKELGPVSQVWPHLTGDERKTFHETQDTLIRLRDFISAVETRLPMRYAGGRSQPDS
jgi:hypothetical protein